MRIEKFWIVSNPRPSSELGDICFQTDLAGLALQVKGGLDTGRHELATMYADEKSAKADARKRLKAREDYDFACSAARA